jgi:hypothetical protein
MLARSSVRHLARSLPPAPGDATEEGGRSVTQQAVERALGKLITDEAFRERFFVSPAAACRDAGLAVSPTELEALSRLPRAALAQFAEGLDGRISRASLEPTAPPEEGASSGDADVPSGWPYAARRHHTNEHHTNDSGRER